MSDSSMFCLCYDTLISRVYILAHIYIYRLPILANVGFDFLPKLINNMLFKIHYSAVGDR